ncbi:MAG: antitoxin MazE-like protein [Candidatus Dormiibacterota bacterium]
MTSARSAKRVREHRSRRAQQDLRPVPIRVPGVRAPGLAEESPRRRGHRGAFSQVTCSDAGSMLPPI